MKKYLIFIFLPLWILDESNSFTKKVNNNNYLIQNDSSKIFKKYRTSLIDLRAAGLSETIILYKDHGYDYKFKVDLIRDKSSGTWQIINDHLILNDNDTNKLISITESYNKLLSPAIFHFNITGINNEEIYHELHVVFLRGKNVKINSWDSTFDVKNRKIKYFNLSSLIPFGSFFPKKNSNWCKIVINMHKSNFTLNWKIKDRALYLSSGGKYKHYHLEEF